MQNNSNLVSVVMSAYNSEISIAESIESILNQSYQNIEFLIIDDCSTDKTAEIIESYLEKNKNIKFTKNKSNLGLTKSLNILIKKSSGQYIARQDADDISLHHRVQEQMQLLKSNNLDFCTTRAIIKDSRKLRPGVSSFLPKKLVLKFKNPFIHGTLLAKKTVINEIGNYDENFFYAQDYKLFYDLLKSNYNFKMILKPQYILNIKDNISENKKIEQNYFAECVRKKIIPSKYPKG
jgi:glycosyltransferase involved in cell wall biosynthesis